MSASSTTLNPFLSRTTTSARWLPMLLFAALVTLWAYNYVEIGRAHV